MKADEGSLSRGAKEKLPWLNEIRLPATKCSVSENRPNPTNSA